MVGIGIYVLSYQLRMEQRILLVIDKSSEMIGYGRGSNKGQYSTILNAYVVHAPSARAVSSAPSARAMSSAHSIQYGREPTYRLWRGPCDRNLSNEE